jgi:transcriptional regulator with XRE-family HTH domain
LTIFDKSNSVQHMAFGETIRKQREDKKLLLRQAAAYLEVDTAFVSKLERGERNASRKQVIKLSEFLQTPQEPLLIIWLADKISSIINNDKQGEEALKLALKNFRTK